MLAAVPLLALAALIAAWARRTDNWREAVVAGSISWGAALVVITEILSLPRALDPLSTATAWVLIAGVSASTAIRNRGNRPFPCIRFSKLSVDERLLLAVNVGVLLLTLGHGLIATPSLWDSLSYHMPRVAHWAQNHSVRHFATHIQRQLWLNPGAEFIVLHFQLLSGGDRLANLPQWLAFAGCITATSLIAQEVGIARRGQIFAAFFVATLPAAVAQATGNQVDLVHAFWLCSMVSVGLRMIRDGRENSTVSQAVLFGAALGLAVLTKATAVLFAAPFCAWFLVGKRQRATRKRLVIASVAFAVAASVNVGHVTRNYLVYGAALSPLSESSEHLNQTVTPAGLASNFARNFAMHFWTRWKGVNSALYQAVETFHHALGITVNESAYTWRTTRFEPRRDEYDEMLGGSPLHVLLIAGSAGAVLLGLRRAHGPITYLIACVLSGAILFSLFLRWQPWHTRLQAPLLILAASTVAYAIEKKTPTAAFRVLAGVLLLNAIPFLFRNPARPLIGQRAIYRIPRESRYFMESPWLEPFYQDLTSYVARTDCSRVGLWMRGNYLEYPLWALLKEKSRDMPEMQHVQVTNPSSVLSEKSDFRPCLIVRIGDVKPPNPFVVPEGYSVKWTRDSAAIFGDLMAAK